MIKVTVEREFNEITKDGYFIARWIIDGRNMVKSFYFNPSLESRVRTQALEYAQAIESGNPQIKVETIYRTPE